MIWLKWASIFLGILGLIGAVVSIAIYRINRHLDRSIRRYHEITEE